MLKQNRSSIQSREQEHFHSMTRTSKSTLNTDSNKKAIFIYCSKCCYFVFSNNNTNNRIRWGNQQNSYSLRNLINVRL